MHLLRNPISHYVLLTVLYFCLVVALPVNRVTMAVYELSTIQYHVLTIVLVLPFIGIWFAAFFGYGRLRSYAQTINQTSEGEDYARLAGGCGWLAWALPVPALVSIILNAVANENGGFLPTAIIVGNYVNLLLPLIAFTLLANSARSLTTRAGIRMTLNGTKSVITLFIILGVLYCYFTFRNFNLLSIGSVDNAFYLPAWLAIITVVVPYLYSWFVGLLAAYEITLYARQSRGVLYRKALNYVGFGIAVVIASSVGLQYVSSIVPRDSLLSLNYMLVTSYVIKIIAAVGYVLIAIGATRLRKIEKV